MYLITKTILRRLVISTVFITSTLLAGVWLTQSLRFIQIIVNHNVSIADYFTLVGFLLPDLLAQILPICIFISILFTYNRIDHDHELLAFRASGRSNWQLAKPGVILSGGTMIIITIMNLYVIPASYRLFRDQEHEIRNELTSIFLQEGAFNTLRGVTAYIKSRNLDGSLNNIFLYYTDKNSSKHHTYAIMAQKGKISSTPEGPRLLLQDGIRQEVKVHNQQSSFFRFEEVSYDLSAMMSDTQPRAIKPYEKSLWELLFPGAETKDPFIISKMRAEAHQRLMLPLFALILAIIALNTVLRRKMNRQSSALRLMGGTFVAITVYMSILGLVNMNAHLNLAIPLAYISVLIVLLLGFFALDRHKHRKLFSKG
ncbi:MAG: LptF/LptG family permease [Alphaproteobacteria bacterium]